MPNGLALATILLIIMLFLAYIISIIISFFTPYYTTPRKFLPSLLKQLKLSKDQSFADLGCGDGRVVFSVYDTFKCKSTGYEISPILLLWLKFYSFFRYPFNSKVKILEESFLRADLSKYNVVYCYLPEDILEILSKKFTKELKDGSIVYSYKNKVGNLKGKKLEVDNQRVYMYTF